MKQWLSKVNSYSIEFPDRPNCVFWTGENVKGVLRLVTNSPITCRCVNVKLTGQSYTHWTYQSGDDTEHAYGHKNYLTRRITGWGNFYKTECLSGAGTDAYFGGTPGKCMYVCLYIVGVCEGCIVIIGLRRLSAALRMRSFIAV
jgi:hypothetical protein